MLEGKSVLFVSARLVRGRAGSISAVLKSERRLRKLVFGHKSVFPDKNCEGLGAESFFRELPISPHLHKERLHQAPESVPGAKLLRVAIIGTPNAGKSVLVNSLTNTHVCPVSKKVHTTRKMAAAISVEQSTQMVFVDTPGLVGPENQRKHYFEDSLLVDPESALASAKLMAVLVDVSKVYNRRALDPRILFLLHKYKHIPAILVMTKIDIVPNRGDLFTTAFTLCAGQVDGSPLNRTGIFEDDPSDSFGDYSNGHKQDIGQMPDHHEQLLNDLCEKYSANRFVKDEFKRVEENPEEMKALRTQRIQDLVKTKRLEELTGSKLGFAFKGVFGWPHFQKVFTVSALKREGISDLKEFLLSQATPAPWIFHSSLLTNRDPVELAFDLIRSKILDNIGKSTPYQADFKLLVWEMNEDILNIYVQVMLEKPSELAIIIGPSGKVIRKITLEANQALRNAFRRDVYLKLAVKLKRSAQGAKKLLRFPKR